MTDTRPIGVFDSGVGGLSVLRDIREELPGEELLYVADSGFGPYGDLQEQLIEARSVAIVEFLLSQQVKAVVVACNTITGVSIQGLRARFPVPIVGMEPAVKPAAALTRSGIVSARPRFCLNYCSENSRPNGCEVHDGNQNGYRN